ncbi:MAG: helix-turn-helix domain-containing protein [Candidatus Micrarchaeota archaeon]
MINKEALEALGLTENDSRVCITLLTHGPQRVADLERIVGIHRRNLYDSLSRLEKMEVVNSFIRNGVRYFQIASMDLLSDMLRKKEEEIHGFLSGIKKIEREYRIPEVHILSGEKGVKMLLDDELRTGKPIYGIASSGFEKRVWDYLARTPHRILAADLPVKLVYTKSDVENRKKALKYDFVEVRVVPDEYKSSVALELYGDTSCIILENIIIRIRDKEVNHKFMMFFNSLWKMRKRTQAPLD